MADKAHDKAARKRPRFSRPLRWGLFLLIIVLTLVNLYFHFRRIILVRALPYVTTELKKYVTQEMGATLEWESVQVDYWGRLVFRDIALTPEGEAVPIAKVALLAIDFNEKKLLSSRGNPASVVQGINVNGMLLKVSRDKEGRWNFAALQKVKKPFEPEKFPLRARVKFTDSTVEYTDPALPGPSGEPLRITDLRGGVDLTDISDVRLALLWNVTGVSSHSLSLKGKVDIIKSSFDLSLVGKLDASPLSEMLRDKTGGVEASGEISLGITSKGFYSPGAIAPEPRGFITLSNVGVIYPALGDTLSDINGTLQLDLTADVANPAFKAYSDGMTFKFGKAPGKAVFRAGWLGEFAYTANISISDLPVDSLKNIIPEKTRQKYELAGTIDGEFAIFGGKGGPSISADFIPSPTVWALGMGFNSGEGHLAFTDNRLNLKDISLGSGDGRTFRLRGMIDFREEPEYLIDIRATGVPTVVVSHFYPPADNWGLAGTFDASVSYYPIGDKHETNIKCAADNVQTKWGELNAVNAAMRFSRGKSIIDGFAAEAYGGRIIAHSLDNGKLQFAISGVNGNEIGETFKISPTINLGVVNAKGEMGFNRGTSGFRADFAIANPSWRDVSLQSITGEVIYDDNGLRFNKVTAIGNQDELIEMDGSLPVKGGGNVDLHFSMKNFDFGRMIPGHTGPPLSRTDINVALNGGIDNLALDASLVENDLNLLGNRAYTCKADAASGSSGNIDNPPVGEVTIRGGVSLTGGKSGLTVGSYAGDIVLTGIEISGALHIGPARKGMPEPMDYRHLLLNTLNIKPLNGNTTGGLPINGTLVLGGHFDGRPAELTGGVALKTTSLKSGLQEIKNFRMGLNASGPASFMLEAEWHYPSGGAVAVSGPAGWDKDTHASVVDLFLNIEEAPINEVLALAGVDVSAYASGSFDGSGHITGPFGKLSLTDFEIVARQGSTLLGMQLDESRIQFGFHDDFLDLTNFEIQSKARPDGGRSSLTGNGRIYLQESGLLPQAQLTASVVDYRLENLQSLFHLDFPIGGRVDAEISYTEQGNKWNLEYALNLGELQYRGRSLPAIKAGFSFDPLGGRMNINRITVEDGSGGSIELGGSITIGLLTALFDPNMRSDLRYQRIDLALSGKDFDLGSIVGFLPKEAKVEGKLKSVDLHIKGKPTAPDIDGTIAPDIGPISYSGFPLADNIGTYSDKGLTWEKGVLKMAGDLFIKRGDAVAVVDGDIDLRALNPLAKYDPRYTAPENNRITLNMATPGPVHLEGGGFWFDVVPENIVMGITGGSPSAEDTSLTGGQFNVTGKLNVTGASLDALRIKIPQGGAGEMPVNYDISIALGSGLRLKAGNMLETTLRSGELHLYGTPVSPQLQGKVEIAQGRLNFLTRTFNLLPGAEISFNPLFGVNPFLKAQAEAVITQHPKAETGAEPLIITATIEAFLSDIGRGIRFSSNYPYTTDELLGILGYQNIFLALQEEGLAGAFTSSLYLYPSGLISQYVQEMAGFSRFELTFNLQNNVVIDLEKELFDNLFLTYNQTFGEGTNYVWGSKYRFRPRSFVGFRYENLDFQGKQDWVYFMEYLMPIK